jgi:hypothetical protein
VVVEVARASNWTSLGVTEGATAQYPHDHTDGKRDAAEEPQSQSLAFARQQIGTDAQWISDRLQSKVTPVGPVV